MVPRQASRADTDKNISVLCPELASLLGLLLRVERILWVSGPGNTFINNVHILGTTLHSHTLGGD